MNLETLDLLTQKVEKTLSTIRSLRSENARLVETVSSLEESVKTLEGQLATSANRYTELEQDLEAQMSLVEQKDTALTSALATVQARESELSQIRLEHGQRSLELNLLQETLQEKEKKIQAAADRLEQVMQSLEMELDLRVQAQPEEVFEESASIPSEQDYESPKDLFGNPVQQ